MPFEERASSWALSLVDILESNHHTRTRVYLGAGAALATIVMWVLHLTNPDIFTFFLQIDSWAKLALGFVLAPPFVVAFAAGSFIYPQSLEPAPVDETGPMATFFYQERASRRWELLIAAGLFAAVNFVSMLVTSAV